jgi:hypothetical protein
LSLNNGGVGKDIKGYPSCIYPFVAVWEVLLSLIIEREYNIK